MSSDISRQRFDPTNDFSAVLMQQGRVLLDADWNEWMEIINRRLRQGKTYEDFREAWPGMTQSFYLEVAGGAPWNISRSA